MLGWEDEVLQRLSPLGRAYHSVYLLLLESRPDPDGVKELFFEIKSLAPNFSRPDQAGLFSDLLNVSIRGLAVDDQTILLASKLEAIVSQLDPNSDCGGCTQALADDALACLDYLDGVSDVADLGNKMYAEGLINEFDHLRCYS